MAYVTCERCYDIGCVQCTPEYPVHWEAQVIGLKQDIHRDFYSRNHPVYDQEEEKQ
jgi:hypothetical protein